MVVLDEHDGRRAVDFLEHGLGELRVDARVLLPVGSIEDRPRVRDVTKRPERAVGESVVVALFLFRGEPDAAQGVGRLVGRHGQASAIVRGFVIAAAAAMGDPDAAGRPHDRIERRYESARWTNPREFAAERPDAIVNVRFAVRDDDDADAAEVLLEQRDKAIARPLRFANLRIGGQQLFDRVLETSRASQSRVGTARPQVQKTVRESGIVKVLRQPWYNELALLSGPTAANRDDNFYRPVHILDRRPLKT